MSDVRTEMASIVKNSFLYADKDAKKFKWYIYPNIPEKMIKIVKRDISSNEGINSIITIIDSSWITSNDLLVLTTSGVYYKAFLMDKIYFNYTDIKDIYKESFIKIKLFDEKIISISSIDYKVDPLRSLLINLKKYCEKNEIVSQKHSGKVKKEEMPSELLSKCSIIIHAASTAAGGVGAGLAQLPCSDSAVIAPIQIGMIIGLGEVFGLSITDSGAKGILTSMAGAAVGRGAVQIAVGWIPVVGNAINTATAAGLTEAIGWLTAYQFYQDSLAGVDKKSLIKEKCE